MQHTALDTETFLIFPGYLAPEMVCVSWAAERESGVVHHSDDLALSFVHSALQNTHTIFANAPFDLAVFAAKWPQLLPVIFDALRDGRVHDVQTREKLLDLARGTFRFEEDEEGKIRAKGYSLFDLVLRRLGVHLDKTTWRLRYHELYDVPITEWPRGAIEYADQDAVRTREVFFAQEQLAQYLGNEAEQVRAHFALHLMSCHGFKTDPAAVDELETWVREAIDGIRDGLVEAGLVRENGKRDTKAAVRRMIEKGGADVILTKTGTELMGGLADAKTKASLAKTPEGAAWVDNPTGANFIRMAHVMGRYVSVSEDACLACGDSTLIDYSTYTRMSNLLSGSIKDLRAGSITPIQSRYEILMETGRTSASGPNIQNLRRAPGVRECFVPRDDNVIIACDYSMAELHTLAQVCLDLFGSSRLADALNAGIDVHTDLAAQLIGVPYEELLERIKDPDDSEAYEARQLAKAGNFGYPGGCGAKRFVGIAHGYGVNIDIQQSARVRAMWMGRWDEMQLYFAHVRECALGDGFYWVKQPRVDRLRAKCTYTSACNSRFQGLAADGAKAALFEMARRQYTEPESALWNTRGLAFVHDEILIEANEFRAHAAAMELQTVMQDEFNRYVPDVPTTAEPVIMRRWSKKAKPTWKDGRLVAWAG
jgi:hypothetical protein